MKQKIILVASTFLFCSLSLTGVETASGRVERAVLTPSELGEPRNIDIWLPADYDTAQRYAVVYMNDGQMLFDSTTTWNRQEWGADEVAARLMEENKIRPCIIVGIWNRDKYRYTEYFPEKALTGLSKWRRARFIRKGMMGKALGDTYLRFIVNELKPYIDSTYSPHSDRENTVIIGSSMGGLISAYAICEYPEVFGGAGCLSTHFPMRGVNFFTRSDNRFARAFRNYLTSNLPSPGTNRIYFDYGTETLDKIYEPYQKKVDAVMAEAGYQDGKQWITRKFEGDDHSEKSWSKRLDIPLIFLLGKQ